MKLALLISIFCFTLVFFRSAMSQTRLGNPLGDSTILAPNSAKGFLYSAIDNLLQINYIPKNKVDSIYLWSNNGVIFMDSLGIICIPSRPGKARIHIYGISGKDTIAFGYKYFTVERIPEPKLTLNTKPLENPCVLRKSDILNSDSLSVFFSSDIKGSENWVEVTKFSLGYNYGGLYISHTNLSKKISHETKQIISKIGPDRNITIRATTNNTNVLKEFPIYRITIIY